LSEIGGVPGVWPEPVVRPKYFQTYTLTGRRFSELPVPLLVLTAADDPIIPVEDFRELEENYQLRVQVERYGGHCGFLQDYRFQAWSQDLIHGILLHSV